MKTLAFWVSTSFCLVMFFGTTSTQADGVSAPLAESPAAPKKLKPLKPFQSEDKNTAPRKANENTESKEAAPSQKQASSETVTTPKNSTGDDTQAPESQLDQKALQEAFRVLRLQYVNREELDPDEMNRSALAGLIQRKKPGIELISRKPFTQGTPLAFQAIMLPDSVGYLRPVAWTQQEAALARQQLQDWAKNRLGGLVLDLRVPYSGAEDYQVAARWLELFLTLNDTLFQVATPGETRPRIYQVRSGGIWRGPLAILVDQETSSAGEVIAAILQKRLRAAIVGKQTLGRTVEYQEIALTENLALRYATAEVLGSEGERFFGEGVIPGIAVDFDSKDKQRAFLHLQKNGVETFLQSVVRPRFNEYALVHDKNPEIIWQLQQTQEKEASKSASNDQATASNPSLQDGPVQDPVLLISWDVVRTQAFLNSPHDIQK